MLLRIMVDRAKKWATDRGLVRRNPVHGEEEYRVPTQENFKHADKEKLKTTVGAGTTMQARPS